jgi:transposase
VEAAFGIRNNRSGFDQMMAKLGALSDPVTVGLEATGHYWLALYDELTRQGYPVTVLNPFQVAAYRRSGLRKLKTDASDAGWIADLMRVAAPPPTTQRTPVLLQLRELTRFRFRLVQQISDCKRKIISILDRVFPEYETLFSSVFLKSSRALLAEAATAQEIADFDLAELASLLASASQGRFGLQKAAAVQEVARRSVGIGFLADAVRIEMRCLLQQVDLLQDQISQLDTQVHTLMDLLPQHITSIPGVGPVTGAAILAEIGDVRRFSSVEKLVAYAGIDPSVYETGQFKASHAHMSKRGSPYLRHALWQAASMTIQYEPDLQSYYKARREEGKAHGVVIGAVCRKLLSRIYVILKEQRPYLVR